MAQRIDLTVAQKHHKGLSKAGKHRDVGETMSICAGACWPPARLVEEDIIKEEDARCPLCVKLGADEGHLLWECLKVKEADHPAIQKSNRFCAEYARAKGYI